MGNLKRIASREGNVIAANNMFDVHYIKYHTGLDAEYLPSWCQPNVGTTERCAADAATRRPMLHTACVLLFTGAPPTTAPRWAARRAAASRVA